jgi:hypothetical protein
MTNEQKVAKRLRTWANARERRNGVGGHGKEGTRLLRDAAALLDPPATTPSETFVLRADLSYYPAESRSATMDEMVESIRGWAWPNGPRVLTDEGILTIEFEVEDLTELCRHECVEEIRSNLSHHSITIEKKEQT